jgi:hypothetical protein
MYPNKKKKNKNTQTQAQWEGSACTQSAMIIFLFPLFSTSSLQIPNGFPSSSQYVS